MAHAFQRLIAEFENHFSPYKIEGMGSETWSARHNGSRAAIRESMKSGFNDWLPSDLNALTDLNEPPRPARRSVSVSHTHDYGGWMAIARPAQIGWDIEMKARIKDHIIERVCDRGELEIVPHKQLLWAAKEAFFKALEDEQPPVIENLTIDTWRALSPGLWSFRGLGLRNGEGLVLDSEPWILAACLIR